MMVSAEKDTSYYPYPGFVNPNVNYKMYWKDAENVLSDLDQFSKLYISHHGCVWSAIDSDEEEGGGGGDDDHSWYLGSQQKFGANAAYSLYGILKKGHNNAKGCVQETYINSFFTTSGITNMIYRTGVDSSDVDTSCTSNQNQNSQDRDGRFLQETGISGFERNVKLGRGQRRLEDEEERGEDDEGGEDDAQDDDAAYSYGMGCSSKLQYQYETFGGSYCDGSQYLYTTDSYEEFNYEMNNIKCFEVFDGSESVSSYKTNAYSLLSASRACSPSLNPYKCPDPHGLLQVYERNLAKAQDLAEQGIQWKLKKIFPFAYSTILFALGGIGLIYYARRILKQGPEIEKSIEMSKTSSSATHKSKNQNEDVSIPIAEIRNKVESVEIPYDPSFYVRAEEHDEVPLEKQDSVVSKVSQTIKDVADSIQQSFVVDDVSQRGTSTPYDNNEINKGKDEASKLKKKSGFRAVISRLRGEK